MSNVFNLKLAIHVQRLLDITSLASYYPTRILKEDNVSETSVPVHYHSSFSQAHEFLLGSQVSLIEAVVSPVANKETPTSLDCTSDIQLYKTEPLTLSIHSCL